VDAGPGAELELDAAAGPFGISIGTVSGKIRRGPFSLQRVVRDEQRPDAADAGGHDDAEPLRSTSGVPASAQASRAAISAYCPEGSSRRASTLASSSSAAAPRAARRT
jgi:hypothetical protein